jgi:tetrahydromethanopterin S-methyltransferase subunit A
MFNNKALQKKDKKMQLISVLIYKYILKTASDNNIDIKTISVIETINLIPFFEYITHTNIELYDFSKINVDDVDVNDEKDLERFVLTHIYYITQCK